MARKNWATPSIPHIDDEADADADDDTLLRMSCVDVDANAVNNNDAPNPTNAICKVIRRPIWSDINPDGNSAIVTTRDERKRIDR